MINWIIKFLEQLIKPDSEFMKNGSYKLMYDFDEEVNNIIINIMTELRNVGLGVDFQMYYIVLTINNIENISRFVEQLKEISEKDFIVPHSNHLDIYRGDVVIWNIQNELNIIGTRLENGTQYTIAGPSKFIWNNEYLV